MKKLIAVLLMALFCASACAGGREPASQASVSLRGTQAEINNACCAAQSVSGTVLSPGDSFSFNSAVGPRTENFGYSVAPDGSGNDTYGGGIDIAASAVYLAARSMPSLSVGSVDTYGGSYCGGYVSRGADAVRTGNGSDLVLYNCGDSVLTITLTASGGSLVCAVYED